MQQNITLELPPEKAFTYQKALIALLGKIEIDACEPVYKEHIKTVYELIAKLNTEEFRISKKVSEQ